jgi:hypothetical protein
MLPILAIAAAKVGSNLVGNIANKSSDKAQAAPSAAQVKKAAFAEMLAKTTNTPQFKHSQFLNSEGISSRDDAVTSLQQMSQQILQSPEISKALGGSTEPFELRFLPDGNVALKKADGSEQVFKLDGQLKESAQKAVSIIESVKIAYPSSAPSASKEVGGSLRIVPGAASSLQA